MNLNEAMSALKSAAKESAKRTYLKHGATEPLFGVLTGDLTALHKRIKTDHGLALQLVATGNADARLLGFLIADPRQLDVKTAQTWVSKASWPMDTYYLGQLLVKSGIWMDCMIAWMAVADEWVQSAGYSLLAQRLKDDADSIPDDLAKKTLVAIEKGIHKAANRARYNMNTALIAIGTYKPGLRDAALAAADRIGPVEVDHGDTSCKTPSAPEYIRKAGAHADRMAGKKASGTKPKAEATSAPAKAAGKSAPAKAAAKAAGKSAPTKAAGKSAPAKAAGTSAPTKAGGKSAPAKATGKSAPTKAASKTASAKAAGKAAPKRAGREASA